MKRLYTSAFVALTATPALAHVDESFHSHGAEYLLYLGAIALCVALARKLK